MPLNLTRSILAIIIPGGVAVAPWLILAYRTWPALSSHYNDFPLLVNGVIFGVVVVLGAIFESVGSTMEVRWDKEREKDFGVKENWYKYLARVLDAEPVAHRYISRLGIDKLTSSAIGMWEYRARFDLKTHCEWALATTYRALGSLSGSASPGLQVNLSIPSWGPAINLGDKINTTSSEKHPSVSPDGKYLFFDRRTGPRVNGLRHVDTYWVDAQFIEALRPKS